MLKLLSSFSTQRHPGTQQPSPRYTEIAALIFLGGALIQGRKQNTEVEQTSFFSLNFPLGVLTPLPVAPCARCSSSSFLSSASGYFDLDGRLAAMMTSAGSPLLAD